MWNWKIKSKYTELFSFFQVQYFPSKYHELMKYMQNLPSGGYLGKLANNSANGKRPFFIFWGCNMVPVPKERKNVNKQLIMTRKKYQRKISWK